MYPTDLTNSQWQVIKDFLKDDRKRKYSLRSIFNALLYLDKTGCQWRMLPKSYPPFRICFYYFRKWTKNNTIGRLNSVLVSLRRRTGLRNSSPSILVIDSQSVKCSEVGVEQTGFDGGKKVKGRKRHLVTDSLGLVLAVAVSTARLPVVAVYTFCLCWIFFIETASISSWRKAVTVKYSLELYLKDKMLDSIPPSIIKIAGLASASFEKKIQYLLLFLLLEYKLS